MKKRITSNILSLLMVVSLLFGTSVVCANAAIDWNCSYVYISSYGQVVDSITFNGQTVNAIYSPRSQVSDYDSNQTFCCAAFVAKFYRTVYGIGVNNMFNGAIPHIYSGSGNFTETSSPVVGDIARGPNHWAIVKAVSGNAITLIEQNAWNSSYTSAAVGRRIIEPESTYTYFHYSGNTSQTGFADFSKYENLGDSFSARIRNAASDMLLTDEGDNIVQYSHSNHKIGNQIWKFTRNSDGSYSIVSNVKNKCFDVHASIDADGTNVHLWQNNHISGQKWYIHKTSDGAYCLRPQFTPTRVLDIATGSTAEGVNAQIYTFNNTSAQKFYFDTCSEMLNIGDNFSALIINTAAWKPIVQNDNYNVVVGTEKRETMDRTVWNFKRDPETGWYTIKSNMNDKYLCVEDESDKEYANVECRDYNDLLYGEKWYILRGVDGYTYLKSACSQKNLDLSGGYTADGVNVQMYSINGSDAQHFSIYTLDADRDKINYTITSDKSSVDMGESVTVTINNAPYATDYRLYVVDPSGETTTIYNKSKYIYKFTPDKIGKYTIYAEVQSPVSKCIGSSSDRYIVINVSNKKCDIDLDNSVTVADATLLQKYIANISTLTDDQKLLADCNGDGVIDVRDATYIQKTIVKLPV